MRRTFGRFSLFLLTFLIYPLTLRDSLHQVHHLRPPIKRLVSLSPALTDSLIELGAKDYLVGVSSFSHLEGVAKLGGIINPNLELLMSLKPELVLVMQPTPLKVIREMENLGLEVFSFKEPQNLKEVGQVVLTLGLVCGKEDVAKEKVKDFLRKVRPRGERRGRIFVGFPTPPYWSACRGTFLDDLAKRAGWENICKAKGWKILSGEEIYRAKPDAVLAPGKNRDRTWQEKFPWKALPISKMKVIIVKPDLLLRPTLRLAEVYRALVEKK